MSFAIVLAIALYQINATRCETSLGAVSREAAVTTLIASGCHVTQPHGLVVDITWDPDTFQYNPAYRRKLGFLGLFLLTGRLISDS